jgi:hypothetical protein
MAIWNSSDCIVSLVHGESNCTALILRALKCAAAAVYRPLPADDLKINPSTVMIQHGYVNMVNINADDSRLD